MRLHLILRCLVLSPAVSRPAISHLFLLILSADRISDNPDLSFVTTICLFACSLSFFVRINPSIFPLPLGCRTGHVYALFQTVCKISPTRHSQIPFLGLFWLFLDPRIEKCNILKILTLFSLLGYVQISGRTTPKNGLSILGDIFSLLSTLKWTSKMQCYFFIHFFYFR